MNTYAVIADLKEYAEAEWTRWDEIARYAAGRASDVATRAAARRGVWGEVTKLIDQLETEHE